MRKLLLGAILALALLGAIGVGPAHAAAAHTTPYGTTCGGGVSTPC